MTTQFPYDPDADSNEPGGDQDIDTAGTDADEQSPTKALGTGVDGQRQKDDRRNPNVEEPGDTNAPDIVGPTGEEMPRQRHDGVQPD